MTLQDEGESILLEAQRLTHGDRQKDYGHPLDDYTRTAALINALFAHKLKEPLDAEDAAQILILVKLSRHQNSRKRDNMVDLAGYGWVSWACHEEAERRTAQRKPHELDENGNCPECAELDHIVKEHQAKTPVPVQTSQNPVQNGGIGWNSGGSGIPLDPRPRCAVHLDRIAPVIGCGCHVCSSTRSGAVTGV